MLHELVKYAQDQGISAEPGFAPKVVRWLVTFSNKGKLLGVQDLRDPETKRSKGREFNKAPHLKFSGDTPMRQFLVDTAQYALLYDQQSPDKKLLTKHGFFLNLLREAASCDAGMGMIAEKLSDADCLAEIHAALAEKSPKAKAADSVTFAIQSSDGNIRIPVEEDTWHDWWREFYPTLFASKAKGKGKKKASSSMRCFITGELVEPAATHPKIKGLGDVGGNIETTLVGFNCDSFCSYGLTQSANAAVSEDSAAQYAAALNELIARNSRRLAGAKVAFWYTGKIPNGIDPIAMIDNYDDGITPVEGAQDELDESDSARAQKTESLQARDNAFKLLDAISKGTSKFDLKNCRYRAITLSGNSGRAVVRDFMEGQFEQLAANVLQWFRDLELINHTGEYNISPRKFESLLTSILRERKIGDNYENWIKPIGNIREQLWKCAIKGSNIPIPRAAIEKAVRRHASMISTNEIPPVHQEKSEKKNKKKEQQNPAKILSQIYNRLALMKAYVNRQARISKTGDLNMDTIDTSQETNSENQFEGNFGIKSALDPNHPKKAYHCGRLMAVLEMIQHKAQGEIGATIAQTHYASASTRPIAAMPRLQTLTQHHLPKIKNSDLRKDYQQLLTEINGKIKDCIPRTFDLEDQCYFHLGYYHQRPHWPQITPERKHLTLRGTEKVRSKSEVIVANILHAMGIDYLYEEPLQIGNQRILPDFTVLKNKFEKPIYIEHLGMMDNYSYRTDWKKKLELYQKAGISHWDKNKCETGENGILITTTESSDGINCTELIKVLSKITDKN